MSASEGVTRIAKLISVSAWVAAGLGILVTAVSAFSGRRPEWTVFILGLVFSLALWSMLQGIVWVVDGFAGNKGERSSILWPRKLFLKKARSNDSGVSQQVARPDLVGVYGWLFFLVISLMILSPLVTLGGALRDFEEMEQSFPRLLSVPAWETYKWVAWGLILSSVAIKIAAGYRLKKIYQKESVNFAFVAIWLTGPGLSIALVIAQSAILNVELRWLVNAELLGPLVGSVVYGLIWSAYLKYSRRVRNTYVLRLPH